MRWNNPILPKVQSQSPLLTPLVSPAGIRVIRNRSGKGRWQIIYPDNYYRRQFLSAVNHRVWDIQKNVSMNPGMLWVSWKNVIKSENLLLRRGPWILVLENVAIDQKFSQWGPGHNTENTSGRYQKEIAENFKFCLISETDPGRYTCPLFSNGDWDPTVIPARFYDLILDFFGDFVRTYHQEFNRPILTLSWSIQLPYQLIIP